MPEVYQKARRAQSLPSPRYMIPSESIGVYEDPNRRRSAPSRPPGGGLYPLDEEGTYGVPKPAPPKPRSPEQPRRRERKPKVYSSYSVDSTCDRHGKKLAKAERDHGLPVSRKSSSASRSGSRGPSISPDRGFGGSVGGSSRGGSRSSLSPEPNPISPASRKKSTSSIASSGYSSSSTQQHRYSSYSRNLRESSFEENEEYEYEENQRKSSARNNKVNSKIASSSSSSNYKSSSNRYNNTNGTTTGLSLSALRKPKIDSWDSMGILGLTTKIWNDTQKRQETFLESTGHFLREDRDSYIM